MQYRTLGRTSLNVSILGFGASPLGDVFGVTDPKEGERAVQLAVERGINFFDVSPYYGLTLAEERLGCALRGRRQKIILATKCGRYGIFALYFCLRHAYVASTLTGMSTPEEVEKNLSALCLQIDESFIQEVGAILAPVSNTVWPSGRPENRD